MTRETLLALYEFLEKEYGGRAAPYEISFHSSEALQRLLNIMQSEIKARYADDNDR